MTTWAGPAARALPRDLALARRLERFRLEHSDVMVLRSAVPPAAWIGRAKITAPTVAELLDALEQMYAAPGVELGSRAARSPVIPPVGG